jgi:Cu/Ag efflux protein CusF
MFKRIAPLLICLMAASVAVAQPGGRGKGDRPAGARPPPTARSNFKPLEIVGVVKAVDAETGRITIAYETVEALNWPPGTQPFPVAKSALLTGVSVGQKVRFSLDSGAIAAIRPFDP